MSPADATPLAELLLRRAAGRQVDDPVVSPAAKGTERTPPRSRQSSRYIRSGPPVPLPLRAGDYESPALAEGDRRK